MTKKKTYVFIILCITTLLLSCRENAGGNKKLVVKNTMNLDRAFETVSVDIADLGLESAEKNLSIMDVSNQEEVVSQQVDTNGDGKMDAILFQPEIMANSEKVFEVVVTDKPKKKDSIPDCYSRFVPERTDDYAWENNRVAFRTYGPTAQKMAEGGVKGGTLSSGMDAWLKRVDYPIVDKWYKKELETDESYHEDTGEGLDNFHVGVSRGVGGIAKKLHTTYYVSKNFTSWKTISTGPIRTSFVLAYADWDAAGTKISEEKKISLDYGSNLSKFEITLYGTDTISAGLTLHEKKGRIGINVENGWLSYWEPHEDSELGMGIVVPNKAMVGYERYETDRKDESNLFAQIQLNANSEAIYYAGFGWKKSGQFKSKKEWEDYLNEFTERLKKPLLIRIE